MYRDGSEKKELVFTDIKDNVGDELRFVICKQSFECKKRKGEVLNAKEFQGLEIITIDHLLSRIEADWPQINKANAFKNIYIIEKQKDGYIKYKVKWME